MAVKNNLEVESLQDYEKMRQAGINVSVGNVTGTNKSYGGGVNYTGRDKNWVNEQTSLIGRNSVKVKVGNKLTIAGAKISNEENGIDKGNLIVKANEIEAHDIVSKDNFLALDANANITRRDIINKQKGNKDNNYVVERYENDGGAGFSGSEVEKVSRATIGNGTIVTNQGTVGVNRDISKSDEKTRDVGVDRIGIDYNDERRGWGKGNQIISENAATIGKFTDKISFIPQFIAGKSNEDTFRAATFKTIRQVEDFIDTKLYNEEHGLIPTSGQYGAVGEFILKAFTENKVDGITIRGRGNTVESMTKIERLDDLPISENQKDLFGNGMAEELERGSANAVNQYRSQDAIKNREEFEITLTYNQTMGRVWDGVESIFGKLFNGKGNISTGIAKGYNTLIRTNNPNQQYHIRQYSQGNLYFEGGVNLSIKNGDMDFSNISLDHTGSPRADKIFYEQGSIAGYKNLGSASNFKDGITSEDGYFLGMKGIISEKKQVNMGEIENHQRTFIQDKFKNISALATIETDITLLLPSFFNKNDKNDKNKSNNYNGEILTLTDDEIKKTVVTQRIVKNIKNENNLNKYINKKIKEKIENSKTRIERKESGTVIRVKNEKVMTKEQAQKEVMNELRKKTAEELSPHRLYFPESFEYRDKLDEVEREKNELYLKWVNENDLDIKKRLGNQYKDLVKKQKNYQLEFQTVVKDRLINIPMVKPEDLIEFRNNILIEEMKSDFPRNNSYDIKELDTFAPNKPKIEDNKQLNINDYLENLRKRIGE